MTKPKRGGMVWRALTGIAECFLVIGEAIIDIAMVVTD